MKTKVAFKSSEGKRAILKFYDSLAEQSHVDYEKILVSTRYGDTFIMASGAREAPPLILLHGSGINSVMWLGDLPTYARNYRVYAVDIPGEPGKSGIRAYGLGRKGDGKII